MISVFFVTFFIYDYMMLLGWIRLTPSMFLNIDIPDDASDSFHKGQAIMFLKDSVLSPSNPTAHLLEMISAETLLNTIDKQITILFTDGGPDHRTTYASVQLGAILYFLKYDKDMVILFRTAPNGSYLNPVERTMSIINLALQHCSFCRSVIPDSVIEDLVMKCSSMSEFRDTVDGKTDVQSQYLESLKPVFIVIY